MQAKTHTVSAPFIEVEQGCVCVYVQAFMLKAGL